MAPHSSTLAWKIPWAEVGCSPWGLKESDTTERLHFHFSLPCIGEGNGNPLQCSCLENPRDGGAWWAAVYGVAQSRTQLKRLSSSSKSKLQTPHKYSPSMNSLTFPYWARPPLIENSVFWDSLPRGKNSKYHIGCLYIEYQNVSLIFHKNPESIFQKIPSTMDHDDLLNGIWN